MGHLNETFPRIVALVIVLGLDFYVRARRTGKAKQRSTPAGTIGRTMTEVRDEVRFDSGR